MKKTIMVEFPDDFEFPEKFDYIGYDGDCDGAKCDMCPLRQIDRDTFTWCGVTKSGGNWCSPKESKPCPFYEK